MNTQITQYAPPPMPVTLPVSSLDIALALAAVAASIATLFLLSTLCKQTAEKLKTRQAEEPQHKERKSRSQKQWDKYTGTG